MTGMNETLEVRWVVPRKAGDLISKGDIRLDQRVNRGLRRWDDEVNSSVINMYIYPE